MRADWVKDENKYGHYESMKPITFQNQIYEEPDIDIETSIVSRYLTTALWSWQHHCYEKKMK
ncbi:MAP kinase Spk1, partial [Dionaea muscipula]